MLIYAYRSGAIFWLFLVGKATRFFPVAVLGWTATNLLFFKPGAHGRRPRAPGFLKLLWFACRYACVCVLVSVCVSAPEAINNQWCDIDRVRLVKQVLRLFPAFNYFIRHLPSIKWMGVAILTQHVVNACQRKLR